MMFQKDKSNKVNHRLLKVQILEAYLNERPLLNEGWLIIYSHIYTIKQNNRYSWCMEP